MLRAPSQVRIIIVGYMVSLRISTNDSAIFDAIAFLRLYEARTTVAASANFKSSMARSDSITKNEANRTTTSAETDFIPIAEKQVE